MILLPALAAVLLSGCRGVGGGLAAAASFAPLWTTLTPTIAPTAVPPPTATPSPTPTATPSATPSPTPSPTPTATPSPTPTATPSPTPSPTPDPATFINGVGFAEIAVMPPEVQAHVREIYARGQELGRNPNAFSKLGDSLSLTSHYLAHFDQKRYNLGIYQSLQGTIDHYRKSFDHFGVALRIGLHAWVAYKPGLADEELCEPDEHMVECEFRLHNPSVLLVRLGTNDVADGDAFERAMRHTVEYSIENGVIPILGTKADRFEGDNANNEIIRRVAAEMRVPLWDFDRVAGTMPNRGLSGDNVHLTMLDFNDYTDPKTMEYGYPVSDLTALVVLQAVRQAIAGEPAGVVDYPTASGRTFGGE